MIIKVGRFYINETQITHVVVNGTGLTCFFSSSDFNKSAGGNPMLQLEDEEALLLLAWLDNACVDVAKEVKTWIKP